MLILNTAGCPAVGPNSFSWLICMLPPTSHCEFEPDPPGEARFVGPDGGGDGEDTVDSGEPITSCRRATQSFKGDLRSFKANPSLTRSPPMISSLVRSRLGGNLAEARRHSARKAGSRAEMQRLQPFERERLGGGVRNTKLIGFCLGIEEREGVASEHSDMNRISRTTIRIAVEKSVLIHIVQKVCSGIRTEGQGLKLCGEFVCRRSSDYACL